MTVVDVEAEVLANRRLSADYNVVEIGVPEIARLAAPGQFVMVKAAPGCDPLLRRPFSVFEVLRRGDGTVLGLSLLNKRVGVGSSLLYGLEPGARLGCLGPLGRPFVPIAPPAEAWMVAGGVGLAPFVTLAAALAARGTPSTLFYGGRSAADLFRVEFFERIGVRLALATEDGTRGALGRITVPLERSLREAPAGVRIVLYACGPTLMMRAVARMAAGHGLACFVSLEQVMGCGLGGCYSCVVPIRGATGSDRFARSCLDGPVFDAERLDWDTLAH
jgi:dihydroorotate dehydrogenase electron transfer subunit